jgi:hypothetical protein
MNIIPREGFGGCIATERKEVTGKAAFLTTVWVLSFEKVGAGGAHPRIKGGTARED